MSLRDIEHKIVMEHITPQNDFVFCLICKTPRDMSKVGLVEKCEKCGDAEYIRSDFYVPDGKPFYGYIETVKPCPKPAPKAKKAKNPPIDKAEWLQWRIDRGRNNLCECGCGCPGHILHHCIIGRKKGHPELDDFRNYALVNAEEDSTRKFDNREWHKYFWYMHCLDLGSETMLEWVNSLPPKMRSRIDWL